ncbi:hypothetical protein evm_011436 [Chilo suppressalis]|nr:hypothetical protein evm_011436 [Chilo suppressalis]
MVREGEEDVREMLLELLEDSETRTMHDRVVILESLACSHDEGFIEGYLGETISDDSPYSIAEKFRIFTAIAESSYNNAKLALRFLRENTNDIRQHYGGSAKLEEALFVLGNNIVENDMATDFRNWLGGNSHNLQDSQNAANVVQEIITENIAWSDRHLQDVYDWMEQNDATTAAPINVPTAGAQAFPMDGIGRLDHGPGLADANDCRCSRDQRPNVLFEARRNSR